MQKYFRFFQSLSTLFLNQNLSPIVSYNRSEAIQSYNLILAVPFMEGGTRSVTEGFYSFTKKRMPERLPYDYLTDSLGILHSAFCILYFAFIPTNYNLSKLLTT